MFKIVHRHFLSRSLPIELKHSEMKANLSMVLTMYHAMKTFEGVDLQLQVFLTTALDGSEWSASRPRRFIPGKRALLPMQYEAG
jgi:hypothetical protein